LRAKRKHILPNGDVAAESHDPRILILELLERDFVTPTNDHLGATSRQSLDKRLAYPGVAASHYDGAVAPRSALRMLGRHRSGPSACGLRAAIRPASAALRVVR
jgi:hypothetical protein